MGRLIVLLVAVLICEAHRPQIKVYEIRKSKDHLDDQYYDPSYFHSVHYKADEDRQIENVIANIIDRLQHLSKRDRYDDETISDDNDASDGVFHDDTRSLPLIVVPDRKILQGKRDRNDFLQKLWKSVLRSEVNDAEDRTSPPRHHGHFDDDY